MASLYVKASIWLTGYQPELAANFPTLSSCLSVYRENFESLTNNSVHNKSSNELKKNSKNSQKSKNTDRQQSYNNHQITGTESDYHDKNVTISLEKITSIDQIKPNDTLHLVVHSYAFEQKRLRTLVPHQLEVHSYKTFTYCDWCHDLLWGIMKQGVKCKLCKRNYHKRCANLLGADCPGVPYENTNTPSINSGSTSSGGTLNSGQGGAQGQTNKRRNNQIYNGEDPHNNMNIQNSEHNYQNISHPSMANNAYAQFQRDQMGNMPNSPSALGMAGLAMVGNMPYQSQAMGEPLTNSKRPHSNNRDNGEAFKIPKQIPGQVAANVKVPHSLVVHNLKQPVLCYWFVFGGFHVIS